MPDGRAYAQPVHTEDRQRIADEATTRTLTSLAEPLARSALGVAVLAVLDALEAAGAGSTVRVRPHNPAAVRDAAPVVLRADRSAPFLARLLALDAVFAGPANGADGAGRADLDLDPGDTGRADLDLDPGDTGRADLGLDPGGAGGQRSITLTGDGTGIDLCWRRHDDAARVRAVAEEASAYLRYLAAPGADARWTEPVPTRFTPPAHGDPAHDGMGRRDGAGHDGAGRDGTGRDGTGHDDAGHDGTGHDDAGHDGTGHDDAGHDDAGRDGSAHDGSAHDAGPIPAELKERWETRYEQESTAAARLLGDWLRLADLPPEGTTEETWLQRIETAEQLRPLLTLWLGWLRDHGVLAAEPGWLRPGPLIDEATTPPLPAPEEWDRPIRTMVETLTGQRGLIDRVLTGRATARELLDVPDLRPARLIAAEPDLEPVWRRLADVIEEHGRSHPEPLVLADLGGATTENPRLRAALDRLGVRIAAVPAGGPIPGGSTYDVVVAVGALHRWADPADAASAVSALLRPGGLLVAVENTELTPLGLLIAGLLEGGFVDADGVSIATPTQEASTWLRLLTAAGLTATGTPLGPTPAVLLRAERSTDPADQPADAPPDHQPEPIRDGTEAEIARIWAELLATTPRSRRDSFFELGGDSLRATRFIAAVRNRYGTTIAMRELFARPQLADVAGRVDAAITADHEDLDEGVLGASEAWIRGSTDPGHGSASSGRPARSVTASCPRSPGLWPMVPGSSR